MTPTITITQVDSITWKAIVTIGEVVSETLVSCDTEEEVLANKEILCDNIRRNDRSLKDVVFDWEIPVETEEPTI